MDIKLHPSLENQPGAHAAASAAEACVHCGFCLATCPTYLESRDERDSPRGRIYLIKSLLETGTSNNIGQHHLDRCLSCRSCETTCPSGVRYGDIIDAGRELLEASVPRRPMDRLQRFALRQLVPHPRRFGRLLRLGQALGPLLPAALRGAVPGRQRALAKPPGKSPLPTRHVILLEGCVQGSATPNTSLAARQLLARLGIGVIETPTQGCCGALHTHLGGREDGRDNMRHNINVWSTAIDGGAEAIISTATGCGSQLAHYGAALADDPAYAERAARIAALSTDLGAYLLRQSRENFGPPITAGARIAVHIPCSQMHALGEPDTVRRLLTERGYTLCATRDDHLCCGSAGSYSLLQPAMSQTLRQNKLAALCGDSASAIATANIGCQLHLGQASSVPVRHWVELMLESLE